MEVDEVAGAGNYDDMAAHYNAVATDGWDYRFDKDTLVVVVRLHTRAHSWCEEPEVAGIVDVDWVYHAHQIAPGVVAVWGVPGADLHVRRGLLGDFQNGGSVPCSCGRSPE